MPRSPYDDFFFMPRIRIRVTLTDQLYREYEQTLYEHKVHMPKCLIEVSSTMAGWGEWNPTTRTIRISEKLVNEYAWTTVVEVLKHEMAHQYVSEAFPYKDHHGASFLKACEALGVATWARTATGKLPDQIPSWRSAELSDETKRHIDRVNKLLSLASSTNEHEAALAMQRAQEILAKNRLERVHQQHASGCDYWFVATGKKRIDAVTSVIFSILREFYFVRPIFIDYFDPKTQDMLKGIDVAGNAEDLQMAEYVYEFLKRTVDNLWDDHQDRTGAAGAVKRSYCLGVLNGFEQKLKEAQKKRPTTPDEQALVVADDKALSDFQKIRYPKIVTGSGHTGARHRDTFSAGVTDGKKIVLNKPITTSDGNRGRLLT